jgi:hypothetical protein
MPYRYLLGDSRRESDRLRQQARLWDPTAHALFDRLKIARGWRVLEVGPGQGSLNQELRRRVRGPSTSSSDRKRLPIDFGAGSDAIDSATARCGSAT